MDDRGLPEDLGWNNDATWVDFVCDLRPLVEGIASKYTTDEALQEDAVQNAMIALLTEYPENIRGFADYSMGIITPDRWLEILRSYCTNVARNQILSTLSSHKEGNLYVGRTQTITHKDEDGEVLLREKIHVPARYASLDQLTEEAGMQVSDTGDITWESIEYLKDDDE